MTLRTKASKSRSSVPQRIPIHPADFVVLAVGVVVAVLGMADVISGKQHRHTLRQKQGRREVSLLAGAQGD